MTNPLQRPDDDSEDNDALGSNQQRPNTCLGICNDGSFPTEILSESVASTSSLATASDIFSSSIYDTIKRWPSSSSTTMHDAQRFLQQTMSDDEPSQSGIVNHFRYSGSLQFPLTTGTPTFRTSSSLSMQCEPRRSPAASKVVKNRRRGKSSSRRRRHNSGSTTPAMLRIWRLRDLFLFGSCSGGNPNVRRNVRAGDENVGNKANLNITTAKSR